MALTSQQTLIVTEEDRLFGLADPVWRAAKRQFAPILIACLLFHLTILALLFLIDQPNKDNPPAEKEIPVQIIVQPPPPPPPKPEPKKPEPKPKQPPPKPQYQREERPAFDAPRAANQETIKREALDDKTRAPVQAKPAPANETKPTPNAPKPAQNAAPAPEKQTSSPEEQKDEKDAEALAKAAPIKDKKSAQRVRDTKRRASLPDNERGAVARELASLEPSPNFTFAAKTDVSPVSGGTEDMRYLSVLYGLIMRQRRFPTRILHTTVQVVVAFWVSDSGALIQTELYRTSGYPEFDHEAVAAVKRAAPFPQPPYNEPHGFIAKMEFPAR